LRGFIFANVKKWRKSVPAKICISKYDVILHT
jgi:hypothetical protein